MFLVLLLLPLMPKARTVQMRIAATRVTMMVVPVIMIVLPTVMMMVMPVIMIVLPAVMMMLMLTVVVVVLWTMY